MCFSYSAPSLNLTLIWNIGLAEGNELYISWYIKAEYNVRMIYYFIFIVILNRNKSIFQTLSNI